MSSVLSNKPSNIYESQSLIGYWWLPEREEDKFPGTLLYNPDTGAHLDVLGELLPIGNMESASVDAIHGFGADGTKVTLLRVLPGNFKLSFPGLVNQEFGSNLLVAGVHCQSEDAFTLKRLDLRYTHLDEWAGKRGIRKTRQPDNSVVVEHTFPDEVKADLDDGCRIVVRFVRHAGRDASIYESHFIHQHAYLSIEVEEETRYDEIRNIITRLGYFLTLCVGRPAHVIEAVGQSDFAKEEHGEGAVNARIRIFERPFRFPTEQKRVDRIDMLLPFGVIEKQFSSILTKWFNQAGVLGYVLDLYFSTIYEEGIYKNRHFLALAQAAEAYHRRTSDEQEMPDEEHKSIVKELLDVVPKARLSWLKPRLKYSNEIGFRRRLARLYDRHGELFKGSFNRSKFKNDVWTARNGLTHNDREAEEKVRSMDLIEMILQLRSVIEANLLSDLGLTNDQVRALMTERLHKRGMGFFV